MLEIQTYLPVRRKQSSSGWISFNAPCCVHNGESQDRRQRGGLKTNETGWSYHCFNCGFTTSFTLGRNLSVKARRFLSWLGVPAEEIERVNLESMRHRSIEGILHERRDIVNALANIEFEERKLPAYTRIIEPGSDEYQYLESRSAPMDYPYLGEADSPSRPGIIIPFTHNGQVVGHTKRFLDNRNPRYISDTQSGYVFGTDLQQDSWQHAIVVEGVFDALSINGLAVLHAEINDTQVRLIRNLGRDITVVPDQDEAGLKLIDRAVELGWAVSIPRWPPGVKDVNDAVIQLGRVGALLMIFAARETNKIKIELARRQLERNVQQKDN